MNCRWLSLLLLVIGVGGCATLEVSTDFDPQARFSGLETYRWVKKPQPPTGDPRIDDNSLLDARVHSAVDRHLAARGYRLIAEGRPDFLVGYYVTLDKETSVSVINDYWGYAPVWVHGGFHGHYGLGYSQAFVSTYEKGTLILDIVKPNGRALMWRGAVSDELVSADSPAARQRQIDAAVEALLARFPPSPQASEPAAGGSGRY